MYYVIIYIILINLRAFFGGGGMGVMLKFLPNGILLLGILHYMFMGQGKLFFPKVFSKSYFTLWAAFLGVFVLSLARTAYPTATMTGLINDTTSIVLLNLLVYVYIGYELRRNPNFEEVFNKTTLRLLAAGGILIGIFLLSYAIGYNHPSATLQRKGELGVILKLIGISYIKKNVPFTWGMHPNTVSIIAGGLFMGTVLLFMLTRQKVQTRNLLLLCAFVCFGFMLVGDSRGTFLMSFLAFVFVFMSTRFKMEGSLRAFVLLVPLLPFLFVSLMQVLGSTGALSEVSRSGDAENVSNLSARTVIWDECMKEVSKFKGIHLVGWGEHGESTAGVSARYAPMFGASEYSYGYDLIVTHNLFFQCFFDIGYLGTIIFLAALLMALNNGIFLYNKGFNQSLFYIGFILYYVLSGTLESNFGNHNRAYNEILMIIVMGIIAFKNEYIRLSRMYEFEQEEMFG